MPHSMTRLISSNLPVVFQCLNVRAEWKRGTVDFSNFGSGKRTSLAALMSPNLLTEQDGDFLRARVLGGEATTFDPWEKRNEFFRLEKGDTKALLAFLRGVELFERPRVGIVDSGEKS